MLASFRPTSDAPFRSTPTAEYRRANPERHEYGAMHPNVLRLRFVASA